MNVLTDQNWALSVGTFLPLAGVLVMLFIPRTEETLHKGVALVTALATMGVGIFTLTQFKIHQNEKLQFYASTKWIPMIHARYIVGLDGMSLPLYLLSMLIIVLVMVYSWDHIPGPGNAKAFLILMLVLETGMNGTFVAQDLILFFVFFEVVLLPMYFMIGVWGGEQRQYASLKFFLYTLFGSALMIVAFLALYFLSDMVQMPDGTMMHTFSMQQLPVAAAGIPSTTAIFIFGGMFVGFGIKVPMFP